MRSLIFGCLLFALIGLGPISCRSKLPPASSPSATLNDTLPAIDVREVGGKRTRLRPHPNKPMLLALWATWCEPCHEEIPALVRWAKQQDKVALTTLAVESKDVKDAEIQEFLDAAFVEGKAYRTATIDVAPLGMRALPTLYLIDAAGVIRATHEGFTGVEALMEWLETELEGLDGA